jgi:hypothetical protein
MLQYVNLYVSRALLASQQGVHSCIKQLFNPSINHYQYVELLQLHPCMCIDMDMCTVIGAACRFECVHINVILMKCVHLLVTL